MPEFIVGLKLGNGARSVFVEAEDALIAALKAKHAEPDASITYVRKRNRRGDARHPHERIETGG